MGIDKMIRLNNFNMKLRKYAEKKRRLDRGSDSSDEDDAMTETVSQRREAKHKTGKDLDKKIKADLASIRRKASIRAKNAHKNAAYSDLLNILSDQQDEVASLQSVAALRQNKMV